jgi:polysaccharide biosynthesis protein PslH
MIHNEPQIPKMMDVPPAEQPLRIAIAYSRIPLPMRRADQMTVAHLLSFLKARGHIVDLYCIETGADPNEAELDWIRNACSSFYPYKHNWISIGRGFLTMMFHLTPLQVGLFSHPLQRRDLRKRVNAGAYDLIYTYYFRSAEVTRGLGRIAGRRSEVLPVSFLALQLSQTLNTRRIANHSPNFLTRLLYELESRLVERYEAKIWQEFTHTLLIGKRDLEAIRQACISHRRPPISNHIFNAHGTDVTHFVPLDNVPERPNHIVFVGVMRTPTNVQAVQWFARNVWPLVRAAIPDATWSIVGREPSSEVLELAKLPGVEVTGTVTDPAEYIARASICIDPMQAGGGMQNKLIEYLSCAKPTVASSIANEGIGGTPDKHLFVVDGPKEFADAVVRLLRDKPLREELGRAGRTFILKKWTWEAHFLRLEAIFYASLLHQSIELNKVHDLHPDHAYADSVMAGEFE